MGFMGSKLVCFRDVYKYGYLVLQFEGVCVVVVGGGVGGWGLAWVGRGEGIRATSLFHVCSIFMFHSDVISNDSFMIA